MALLFMPLEHPVLSQTGCRCIIVDATYKFNLLLMCAMRTMSPGRTTRKNYLNGSCGWVPPLSKISDYNPNTGLHKSLAIDCVQGSPQYWVTKEGTTAKAASPAGPPSWSGSVQGLTQHFEQMSMRGGTHHFRDGILLG